MDTTTHNTNRTAHLLELMKKGDDAFNARDFAAVDAVHHPDMIAYITGLAEPVYGRSARRGDAAVLRIFPDVHVDNDRTRSSSEAATGSPWSPAPQGPSPGR